MTQMLNMAISVQLRVAVDLTACILAWCRNFEKTGSACCMRRLTLGTRKRPPSSVATAREGLHSQPATAEDEYMQLLRGTGGSCLWQVCLMQWSVALSMQQSYAEAWPKYAAL